MVFANVAKRVRSDHDCSKPNCEEKSTSNGIQHEPGSQRGNFPYLGIERYVRNWAKARLPEGNHDARSIEQSDKDWSEQKYEDRGRSRTSNKSKPLQAPWIVRLPFDTYGTEATSIGHISLGACENADKRKGGRC